MTKSLHWNAQTAGFSFFRHLGVRNLTRCCVIPTPLQTPQSHWNGIPRMALNSSTGRRCAPTLKEELQ